MIHVRFILLPMLANIYVSIEQSHAGKYGTHIEAQVLRFPLLKNIDFGQLSVT